MSRTADLFADAEPASPEAPQATALSVRRPAQAPLSAAAKAFNLQLARIDKLKRQLDELDVLAQAHRLALHDNVAPLQKRQAQAMREMALFLDQHMGNKVLSAVQRETARQILCHLAQALAEGGDDDMAELHDRHHPKGLAEMARERADDMRAQLEELLGEPLDAALGEHGQGASAEELLHAGVERLRQSLEDEMAHRRERAEKRKAKKKPSAAQAAAKAQIDDAETSLRKLFRQLASALHPDRETDEQLKLAKSALMSEANAAYERRDLVALMQIEQRAALSDPLAASRMTDDKLAALTRLLKQQVADLERERSERSQQLALEFDLPPHFGLTPRELRMVLQTQILELESALGHMDQDLKRVQTDAGLKRWLTEQRKETLRQQREERLLGLGDFDF